MSNTLRTCKNCGKEYSNMYKSTKGGKDYTLPTTFCSKSCASIFNYQNNNSIIKTLPDREDVVNEIRDFISNSGEYCTIPEITKGISRSSKSLTKLGILTTEINRELGFKKPKSKFENNVRDILEANFNKVEPQKKFDGLVGTTGHPLRCDFYIPEINTVVEADGAQHTDVNHPWSNANPNGSVSTYDEIKNNYMKENGIRLVRVPYKTIIKKDHVLSLINDI